MKIVHYAKFFNHLLINANFHQARYFMFIFFLKNIAIIQVNFQQQPPEYNHVRVCHYLGVNCPTRTFFTHMEIIVYSP